MKVFLVGLTIAAAVVGGGIGYASLQTGVAPVWQRSSETDAGASRSDASASSRSEPSRSASSEVTASRSDSTSEPASASRDERTEPVDDTIARAPRRADPNDIVISEADLNQRVNEALSADPKLAPIFDITNGVDTKLENGRIESGITLNLNDLPLEELPVEAQDAVSEMMTTFPFLANRPVYVGIEGRPNVVEGEISLDDTNVKFGPLKLPVSNVASQLGVSQSDIEKQLNQVIEQQGLTPEDIQITDGQIVITGL